MVLVRRRETECVTQTRFDMKAGRGNKALGGKRSERLETLRRKRNIIGALMN